MTALPEIHSERLTIRQLTMNDRDTTYQFSLDAGWVVDSQSARASHEKWLTWTTMNYGALASLGQPPYGERGIALQDGTLVGMVGVVPVLLPFGILPYYRERNIGTPEASMPEVGLFWSVGKAHRGNGYATEAAQTLITQLFTQFNLQRIVAQTDYDNHPSQRVMQRLGMTINKNPNSVPVYVQVVSILENPQHNAHMENKDSE